MITQVVKLPADGSPQWAILTKNSTLTGYGDDWRAHVAHSAKPTIVIDYSTAPWQHALDEAVLGPMVKVGITEDEGPGSFDYVTPETKARRAKAIGATVTYLTTEQARDLECPRCEKCNQPTFKWGGKVRHHGAKRVRTDNDNGVECPT